MNNATKRSVRGSGSGSGSDSGSGAAGDKLVYAGGKLKTKSSADRERAKQRARTNARAVVCAAHWDEYQAALMVALAIEGVA